MNGYRAPWLRARSVLMLAATLATVGCGKGSGHSPSEGGSPSSSNPAEEPGTKGEGGSGDVASAPIGFERFPSLAGALEYILSRHRPLVIGLGEFHQTTTARPVVPTLDRVSAALETLARSASDLILETWVQAGRCGADEEVINNEVREVTERPPAVENQLVALMNKARERGLGLHVMTMECADYEHVFVGGEVDYEKMLTLIKGKLAGLVSKVWRHREGERAADPARPQRTILVYGGALHNERDPPEGLEDLSYAVDVRALVGDEGYLEIDLLVPEYIEGNPLVAQEPWYPSAIRHADEASVLVYERAASSYAVVLRKGLVAHDPAP